MTMCVIYIHTHTNIFSAAREDTVPIFEKNLDNYFEMYNVKKVLYYLKSANIITKFFNIIQETKDPLKEYSHTYNKNRLSSSNCIKLQESIVKWLERKKAVRSLQLALTYLCDKDLYWCCQKF